MVYYFAYGSNMSERQMNERIGITNYRFLSCGKLLDYELRFNKTPRDTENPKKGYANIELKENSVVEGIIYDLDNAGLEKLDRFEGIPIHYQRQQLEVLSDKGKIFCEVYISFEKKDDLKPSKEYLSKLLAGKLHLSNEYYKKLESISTLI